MNHIKNLAKQVLAGALAIATAAVLISLAAPRAVHAAVAALVEVANTPANPVPNADVTRSASNLVNLYCVPGQNCSLVGPGGGTDIGSPYTVPAGQNLVVKDVQITTVGGGSSSFFGIGGTVFGPDTINTNFFVPNDGLTHSFQVNGVVIPAGSKVLPNGEINYSAFVRGYLTPN